jgi:hypothetical protein
MFPCTCRGHLVGDHAHIARNETAEPAQNLVTYFAPPGAGVAGDATAPAFRFILKKACRRA